MLVVMAGTYRNLPFSEALESYFIWVSALPANIKLG
jgi:hypothetical protein